MNSTIRLEYYSARRHGFRKSQWKEEITKYIKIIIPKSVFYSAYESSFIPTCFLITIQSSHETQFNLVSVVELHLFCTANFE